MTSQPQKLTHKQRLADAEFTVSSLVVRGAAKADIEAAKVARDAIRAERRKAGAARRPSHVTIN